MNCKKHKWLFLAPIIILLIYKAVKYCKPRMEFASKIEQELTENIEQMHGKEHRKVTCIVVFNAMYLEFHYPIGYLEANPGLEEECRQYIAEHYPEMVTFVKKITFKPFPVKPEQQEL